MSSWSNGLTVVEPSLRAYTTYIKLIEDEIGDLPLAALEDRRIRFMTFVGQQLFDSHLPMRLYRRSRPGKSASRPPRAYHHPSASRNAVPAERRRAEIMHREAVERIIDSERFRFVCNGSLGLAFEL